MSVGLVVVSHSADLARGLVELARQMAPSVALVAAGGTDDGEIGTSFELVTAALGEADTGDGVVVLGDLGSAMMTAETAIEFLDDSAHVRLVDAPLVEGTVAAAVTAETGGDLEAVAAAAASASSSPMGPSPAAEAPAAGEEASDDGYERRVTLRNPSGLHARPAAEFVKLATRLSADVTVNGTSARSLLGVMALGLGQGAEAVIRTPSAAGRDAVDALADLVESGFGEA